MNIRTQRQKGRSPQSYSQPQKGTPMSTSTQTRNEPAGGLKQRQTASTSAIKSGPNIRLGGAMNYTAWVAKAAKQPMVLETVDLGPLGAEDVEVAAVKVH